ncbi:cytochrome c oxidase subunit 1 [Borealophlyctis nickersoniae]|nr:cytochrome c oxidase subunit 1 [Borealophlyctis nickersoniae]
MAEEQSSSLINQSKEDRAALTRQYFEARYKKTEGDGTGLQRTLSKSGVPSRKGSVGAEAVVDEEASPNDFTAEVDAQDTDEAEFRGGIPKRPAGWRNVLRAIGMRRRDTESIDPNSAASDDICDASRRISKRVSTPPTVSTSSRKTDSIIVTPPTPDTTSPEEAPDSDAGLRNWYLRYKSDDVSGFPLQSGSAHSTIQRGHHISRDMSVSSITSDTDSFSPTHNRASTTPSIRPFAHSHDSSTASDRSVQVVRNPLSNLGGILGHEKWYALDERDMDASLFRLGDAAAAHHPAAALGRLEKGDDGRTRFVLDVDKLQREEVKRQEIIFELIVTEREYIRDLNIIINLFLKKMREKEIVPAKGINIIFSNIEQILPVNQELLNRLEQRRRETFGILPAIGDIFFSVAQFLKMYTLYCGNQPEAMMYLKNQKGNQELNLFLQVCLLRPDCRGLDIGAFLLKPVQRICKYPLLLRELFKHTPPGHPDHQALEASLRLINNVVDVVNERRRFVENQQKLFSVMAKMEFTDKLHLTHEPSRTYKYEGTLTKYQPSSMMGGTQSQRFAALFSDWFILAKPSMFHGGKAQVVKLIGVKEIVKVAEVDGGEKHPNAFSVTLDSKKEFYFCANAPREKAAWLSAFNGAIRDAAESIGQSPGALLQQRTSMMLTSTGKEGAENAEAGEGSAPHITSNGRPAVYEHPPFSFEEHDATLFSSGPSSAMSVPKLSEDPEGPPSPRAAPIRVASNGSVVVEKTFSDYIEENIAGKDARKGSSNMSGRLIGSRSGTPVKRHSQTDISSVSSRRSSGSDIKRPSVTKTMSAIALTTASKTPKLSSRNNSSDDVAGGAAASDAKAGTIRGGGASASGLRSRTQSSNSLADLAKSSPRLRVGAGGSASRLDNSNDKQSSSRPSSRSHSPKITRTTSTQTFSHPVPPGTGENAREGGRDSPRMRRMRKTASHQELSDLAGKDEVHESSRQVGAGRHQGGAEGVKSETPLSEPQTATRAPEIELVNTTLLKPTPPNLPTSMKNSPSAQSLRRSSSAQSLKKSSSGQSILKDSDHPSSNPPLTLTKSPSDHKLRKSSSNRNIESSTGSGSPRTVRKAIAAWSATIDAATPKPLAVIGHRPSSIASGKRISSARGSLQGSGHVGMGEEGTAK